MILKDLYVPNKLFEVIWSHEATKFAIPKHATFAVLVLWGVGDSEKETDRKKTFSMIS